MNLLVSVRSVEEAEAALAGGAGLIDVKEPNNGALGFAGVEVIAAVLRMVAAQRPVSAALGELSDSSFPSSAWERRSGSSASADRHRTPCHSEGCEAELRDLRSQAELGNEMKGLAFAKWGLAGCRDWSDDLAHAATFL